MAPMVAVNNGGDLDFYHVGGLVRLTIKGAGDGIRKIRITFNGMTYITGTYTVSNAGTASAYATLSSGSYNYVEFTKTSDFDEITILNIPVPSGDYSSCTGLSIGLYDSSSSLIDTYNVSIPWISVGRGKGKKESYYGTIDLSKINPITWSGMARETANCYIVTEPGYYKIPLYYGNAIVNGEDNISSAAPAKGDNADRGNFVDAYNNIITEGNIKLSLESNSITLNTSGGKLIWSTASSLSSALVVVNASLSISGDEAYLLFEVPEEGFQEGSALIGVLKSGSTTEYVWAWHIWITDGSVLATDTYTNYASQTFDILNRPLGGRGGTSGVSTYYQFGMPFPLPPSDGSTGSSTNQNALLYDENGTYTFNYDSGNTITSLGVALSKPYLPRWANNYFYDYNNGSPVSQKFINMWEANGSSTNLCKTIYDPCPAGFIIPSLYTFTGFTSNGNRVSSGAPTNCNVVGSFNYGWYFKRNSSDATGVFWASSGYRTGGSYPLIVYNIGTGVYWTNRVYSSDSSNRYSYDLNFNTNSIIPQQYDGVRYTAMNVRPCRIK